jgi:hypothetical protein
MAADDTEARALLDSRVDACKAKDIDRLMSLYSPTSFTTMSCHRSSTRDPPMSAETSCCRMDAFLSVISEDR